MRLATISCASPWRYPGRPCKRSRQRGQLQTAPHSSWGWEGGGSADSSTPGGRLPVGASPSARPVRHCRRRPCPDRGRSADRRVDYHDPALPPRWLIAFGLWLRECSAATRSSMSAPWTLDRLPGETVALAVDCFPEIVAVVAGRLSVHREQSGRGRAGQRRIGAVPRPSDAAASGAGLAEGQPARRRVDDMRRPRARPPPPRPAGEADRRDGAATGLPARQMLTRRRC